MDREYPTSGSQSEDSSLRFHLTTLIGVTLGAAVLLTANSIHTEALSPVVAVEFVRTEGSFWAYYNRASSVPPAQDVGTIHRTVVVSKGWPWAFSQEVYLEDGRRAAALSSDAFRWNRPMLAANIAVGLVILALLGWLTEKRSALLRRRAAQTELGIP